jgi:hypothetical protein
LKTSIDIHLIHELRELETLTESIHKRLCSNQADLNCCTRELAGHLLRVVRDMQTFSVCLRSWGQKVDALKTEAQKTERECSRPYCRQRIVEARAE